MLTMLIMLSAEAGSCLPKEVGLLIHAYKSLKRCVGQTTGIFVLIIGIAPDRLLDNIGKHF